MSQRSTAAAQERPSAMAQTIRLCPRVWSPHTKTPSTLVAQSGSLATVPRGPTSMPSSSTALWRSVPTKPMANSTRSASISNSEPGTSSKIGRPSSVRISTVWPRSALTAPDPLSTNSVVVTEKRRCPPSSWAEEVRRMSGHSGHGLSASRSLGGSAMISSWCTEAAP